MTGPLVERMDDAELSRTLYHRRLRLEHGRKGLIEMAGDLVVGTRGRCRSAAQGGSALSWMLFQDGSWCGLLISFFEGAALARAAVQAFWQPLNASKPLQWLMSEWPEAVGVPLDAPQPSGSSFASETCSGPAVSSSGDVAPIIHA